MSYANHGGFAYEFIVFQALRLTKIDGHIEVENWKIIGLKLYAYGQCFKLKTYSSDLRISTLSKTRQQASRKL